jgi:long-subunit acyl-CoA synthetase (AMP-forming)
MNFREVAVRLKQQATHSLWMLDPDDQVRQISFGELHREVEEAVRALEARGVTAAMRVGILAENCLAWIVYDLAMLAVGCTSVAFPREVAAEDWSGLFDRYDLSLMLVASGEQLPLDVLGGRVHVIDGPSPSAEPALPPRRPHAAEAATPALIFSSGSTGKSKCMITNPGGVWFVIDYLHKLYELNPQDRLLLFLPFSHYQQRGMVYAAIWLGMDLAMVAPQQLFAGFRRLAPTLCVAPPILYETIYAQFHNRVDKLSAPVRLGFRGLAGAARRLPNGPLRRMTQRLAYGGIRKALGGSMRAMIAGMAPIKRDVLEFFAEAGMDLYEGYGTSETGLIAANGADGNRIGSVGKPPTIGEYRLAEDGEIIVGGRDFAAYGYLHAEPDGERVELFDGQFATGDIGRFDEDGYLYLIGRKKEIIITSSGLKIHPELVEAKLAHHHMVERVAVFGSDLPFLAAVIVPRVQGQAAVEAALHEHVQAVNQTLNIGTQVGRVIFSPQSFTSDNGLLTRTLKLERRAIFRRFEAEIRAGTGGAAGDRAGDDAAGGKRGDGAAQDDGAAADAAYAAPRDDVERALAEIWSELLGVERVGIHDNFLALGGNSLLALQVTSRAQRAGLGLDARQLFEHLTIATLAAALARAPVSRGTARQAPPTAPAGDDDLPLTPNQRWYAETFDVEHHAWAMTVLWQAPAGLTLDLARLRAAAERVFAHHDVLRLRMYRKDQGWAQRLEPTVEVPLEEHDLSALDPDERRRALREAAGNLQEALSIVRGPVLALALCRVGREPDKLIISIHHSVYDYYSLALLMEDFLSAYARLGAGQEPELPPVPTSYRQYLRALASYGRSPAMEEERAFWLDTARLRPVPALPVDLPGGRHTDRNSRRHAVVLAADLIDDLRAWLTTHPESNLNELLLFGLVRSYARWTGGEALRLDLEHNGRIGALPGTDLVRTVGPTNVKVPVLFELEPETPPKEAFGQVQRTLRETMEHAMGFGLLRYGEGRAAHESLLAIGSPQVFFNNRGLTTGRSPAVQAAFEPLILQRSDGGENPVSYDLMVECDNTPEGPTVSWVYSSALHRPQTIEALADGAIEEIRGLVRSR